MAENETEEQKKARLEKEEEARKEAEKTEDEKRKARELLFKESREKDKTTAAILDEIAETREYLGEIGWKPKSRRAPPAAKPETSAHHCLLCPLCPFFKAKVA